MVLGEVLERHESIKIDKEGTLNLILLHGGFSNYVTVSVREIRDVFLLPIFVSADNLSIRTNTHTIVSCITINFVLRFYVYVANCRVFFSTIYQGLVSFSKEASAYHKRNDAIYFSWFIHQIVENIFENRTTDSKLAGNHTCFGSYAYRWSISDFYFMAILF